MKNNGKICLLLPSLFLLFSFKALPADHEFTLPKLLELASNQSLPVKESGWDTRNQEIMKDAVKDQIWPRINLDTSLNYYSSGDSLSFTENFKSYLQVNWSFLDFKTFYATRQFAAKALEASYKNLSETRRTACVKAIQLYYQFWQNEKKRILMEKEESLIKKQFKDAQFLYSKGNISKKDLETAEKSVLNQKTTLDALTHEIKNIKMELANFLMLKEAFTLSKPPSDLHLPDLPDQMSMEQKAISNSSSYSSALESQKETQDLIDNFSFRRYTQLSSTLFFSNTLNMNEWDWNKEKENFFYGMGIGWKIPILNKGEKKRKLKQAEISLEKARMKINSIPGELSQKVENLYDLFREKKEQIRNQKDSIKKTESDFSLLKRKYKNGDLSDREFDKKEIEHEQYFIELNTMEYEAIMIRAEIDLLCANDIRWLAGPVEALEGISFQTIIGEA